MRPSTPVSLRRIVVLYARVALGVGFLSAVADRFGLWGAPGAQNVAWGDFAHFVTSTGKLNPYLSESLLLPLAWVVTIAETALGLALLLGTQLRGVAIASGGLLLAFAVGLSAGTGIKTAFDASVFAASACAFLALDASRR